MNRRRMIQAAVIGSSVVGLAVLAGLAAHFSVLGDYDDDDDDEGGQEALSRVLRYTKVSLQQGLAASEEIGQPISGKFEVQNRKFQLLVYTAKEGQFSEVLVDPLTGKVAHVEPLKLANDLANAQSHSAAIANSKTTLKEAVDKASGEAAGFRAVGILPNLRDGHPVATVLLLKGEQSQLVNVALD